MKKLSILAIVSLLIVFQPAMADALKNGEGGLCLDAHRPDATNNGGKVQVYKCHSGLNQQWSLVNGALKNGHGLCLDAHRPDAKKNGGKVQVYKCHYKPNQQWELVDK